MEECFILILSQETSSGVTDYAETQSSCVKFIMYLSIFWVKHILLQYKSTEITKKSVNLLLSPVSKLPGAL